MPANLVFQGAYQNRTGVGFVTNDPASSACTDAGSVLCLAPLNGKRPAFKVEDRGYRSRCWIWQGSFNGKGYASRSGYLVHRQAFLETGGQLGEGEEAHHLCEQRACVRPNHIAARSPLAHRRAHGAPLAEAILSTLRDEGPLRFRELRLLTLDVGCTNPGATLDRMVKRGELVRLERGLYALPDQVRGGSPIHGGRVQQPKSEDPLQQRALSEHLTDAAREARNQAALDSENAAAEEPV